VIEIRFGDTSELGIGHFCLVGKKPGVDGLLIKIADGAPYSRAVIGARSPDRYDCAVL
jgi:hypothetical protein